MNSMAYENWQEMLFGISKHHIKCGFGLEIGSGEVIPEIKPHPLPGMEASLDSLLEEYKRITNDIIQKYGIKCALRATIADVRRSEHNLRKSKETDLVLESFERCARAGADVLSIESIGGKEVFNYALTRQDLPGILFAIAVLGSRDMEFLWERIVEIAERNGSIPGGDTDCAHANTTKMLAGGMVEGDFPHTIAALIRAMAGARSLVAVGRGAKGPLKDCGYENPIIKSITGVPISMEGKASACAHMDLMGNLAASVCDLWSNEAVEYRDMFGGTTVAVFTEILGYDASLLNTALATGYAECLRDLLIASDKYRDPQALVICPKEI